MSNFVGGDTTEIVCNHPTLGDFRFEPKSNESFTSDKGGIRNNDDANAVTASGKSIVQKNRVGWSMEGPIAADIKTGYEEDALNALSESPEDGVWTFSHISGGISKGTGRPVGDIQVDRNTAQLTIKIAGGGKLEEIA